MIFQLSLIIPSISQHLISQSLATVYKWLPGILLLIWKSNTRQILVSIYYISISNTCWRLRDSLPLHSCALVLGRHSWRLWRRYSRRNSTSHWSVRATYLRRSNNQQPPSLPLALSSYSIFLMITLITSWWKYESLVWQRGMRYTWGQEWQASSTSTPGTPTTPPCCR